MSPTDAITTGLESERARAARSPAQPSGGALPVAARRHPLVAAVRRALVQSCEVALDVEAGPILVGVSGGADSLALLLALRGLQHQLDDTAPAFRPIAVHVNHHLRGKASMADAKFVSERCATLGIECAVRDAAVDPDQPGVEATARRRRYEAFTEEAATRGIDIVAVAHHAEDQFETMLMNLARGAGLDGLSGMAWSRPLGPTCRLIRPLLRESRAAGRSLCDAAGVHSRYDEMNQAVTYARTRVRHVVRPMLEAIWPGAPQRAAATAEILALASQLLEERLEATFGAATCRAWPRRSLAALPVALVASGLRRAAVGALGCGTDDLEAATMFAAAERICSDRAKPARFALTGSLTVAVRAHDVRLVESKEE